MLITTGYLRVVNGQSAEINLQDFTRVVSARVRWRGATRTINDDITNTNTGSPDTSYPGLPVGHSFYSHMFSASGSVTNIGTSPITVTWIYDDSNGEVHSNPIVLQAGQSTSQSAFTQIYFNHIGSSVYAGWTTNNLPATQSSATATASTVGVKTIIVETQNPSATIAGQVTKYTGQLNNGVVSAWYTLLGLVAGQLNNINHSFTNNGHADVEIEYTVEPKLSQPERESPVTDTRTTDIQPYFVMTLPANAENSALKYHARIRFSEYSIMSPVTVYESKSSQIGWELWNGAIWVPFPATGVNSGSKVRYQPQLSINTYYWDGSSWDGYGYGFGTTAWKLRILATVSGLYALEIGGTEYLAYSLTISETSNGEIGQINAQLNNSDGLNNTSINYGDSLVCAFNDSLGNTDEFMGIVRTKQPNGTDLTITAITGDGILSERLILQDYTSQDIGLTVKHIIENYCQPLTANNVNIATGFVAPVSSKDKTPIAVLEDIRRNYGVFYFVDKDWDVNFYLFDSIDSAIISIQYGSTGYTIIDGNILGYILPDETIDGGSFLETPFDILDGGV